MRRGDRVRVTPPGDDMGGGEWTWDGGPFVGVLIYVNGDQVDVEMPNGEIEPFPIAWLARAGDEKDDPV